MELLYSLLSKYGWTASDSNGVIELTNRKGTKAALIKIKEGGRHIITDVSGNKLRAGKCQIEVSVEKVLTEYFYCRP